RRKAGRAYLRAGRNSHPRSVAGVRGESRLYVIGGVLVLGLLLRDGLVFVVAVILLLTAATSRLWERGCLVGLQYRRTLGQTRAFFGEEVALTIEITNDKPLPLAWLEVEDGVPGQAMEIAPGHIGPSHIPNRRILGMLLSVKWFE